jgi:hypothetical protein
MFIAKVIAFITLWTYFTRHTKVEQTESTLERFELSRYMLS